MAAAVNLNFCAFGKVVLRVPKIVSNVSVSADVIIKMIGISVRNPRADHKTITPTITSIRSVPEPSRPQGTSPLLFLYSFTRLKILFYSTVCALSFHVTPIHFQHKTQLSSYFWRHFYFSTTQDERRTTTINTLSNKFTHNIFIYQK